MAGGLDIRQSSFAGGEFADTLYGRSDLAKYDVALRRCRNFFVNQHGALLNRPGTRFVAEVKDSTKPIRLISFIFNNEQSVVLEFGHHYVRFHTNGAPVVAPSPGGGETTYNGTTATFAAGAVIEQATPYDYQDLKYLKYAQVGDVITLVCVNPIARRDYAPLELKRLNADGAHWSLDTIVITRSAGPLWRGFLYPLSAVRGVVPDHNTAPYHELYTYQGGYTCVAPLTLDPYSPGSPITLGLWRSLQDGNVGHYPWAGANVGVWWVMEQQSGAITTQEEYDAAVAAFQPTLNHFETPGRPAKPWRWVVTAVGANGVESLPSAELSPLIDVTNLTNTDLVCLATDRTIKVGWYEIDGAKYYNVYRGRDGLYGYVGESATGDFTDDGAAPDYTNTPPTSNNPFGATGKYPGVVAYYQQRRWFGASLDRPQTIWGSKIGDFYNFDVAQAIPKDDDSVEFTLASRQYEVIRNLLGLRTLLTLTGSGEWAVSGAGGGAITPSQVEAKPQSYRGSSILDPIAVGNVALYVQGMGNLVRELVFNFYVDSYDGNDLTVFSSHLFRAHRLVDWAYAAQPYSILWGVRDDGALLGCSYLREHELTAWHWHDSGQRGNGTADVFENVCAAPEGVEHGVYVCVRRWVEGAWTRYIERFASRILPRLGTGDGTVGDPLYKPGPDVKRCVFLDSSITYDGEPATVFHGFDHLEGCEVGVLADGNVLGPYTVTDGAIDISDEMPDGASVVTAGLGYFSEIETLDLKIPNQNVRSNVKSVNRVSFEVVDSRGMSFGPSFDRMEEWKQRKVSDAFGPVALFTGLDHTRFPSHYEHNARVCLRQSEPLPVTLVALSREVDVGGG